MRPFGGFGIDGLASRSEVSGESIEGVALGGAQDHPTEEPADVLGGGPPTTEHGYTSEPVGGFDRWPGGLKG